LAIIMFPGGGLGVCSDTSDGVGWWSCAADVTLVDLIDLQISLRASWWCLGRCLLESSLLLALPARWCLGRYLRVVSWALPASSRLGACSLRLQLAVARCRRGLLCARSRSGCDPRTLTCFSSLTTMAATTRFQWLLHIWSPALRWPTNGRTASAFSQAVSLRPADFHIESPKTHGATDSSTLPLRAAAIADIDSIPAAGHHA